MRKLDTPTSARIVKLEKGDWYILWRAKNSDGSTSRFRFKNGLNRITDLELRQKWADRIVQSINEAALEGKTPTEQEIKRQFEPSEGKAPPSVNPTSLDGFFQEFIDLRRPIIGPNTSKTRQNSLNNLRKFAQKVLKKNTLDWDDLDQKFPLRFQTWAYDKPRSFSQNTVAKIFIVLRRVLTEADECGLNVGKAWKSKSYHVSEVETDAIALNMDEVTRLANFDLSQAPPRLMRTRDVFIMACLTGFRFSDVSKLTIDNLKTVKAKDGQPMAVIHLNAQQKTQHKAGSKVVVPIHPIVQKIIQANRGAPPVAFSNQKMNVYIKELGELVGFTESVILRGNKAGKMTLDKYRKCDVMTTHTARRSFATIAFVEWAMPSALVMKATGHKSERDFLKYIKISQEQAAVQMQQYFK